jgi:transcriptional regulator EpsA
MSEIGIQGRPGPPSERRDIADRRANDGLGFLTTAEASLRIEGHMDLCLWLQGDVQRFLPHEILIAAWGDFDANVVSFDVISPLPPLRTEILYVLGNSNPSAIEVCKSQFNANSGKKCGAIPFLANLRDRWHEVGCTPYVVLREAVKGPLDFICPDCNSDSAEVLSTMQSSLVHGYSDHRGKLECIYVFLSAQDLSDPIFRRSLRFLLPYLDHSLRQVSHLPIQSAYREPVVVDPEDQEESIILSQRETEIMQWVRVGKTNYEIGVILNISAFTVKNHLQRIFKKLDTSSRAQAVDKLSRVKNSTPAS